MIVEKELDLDIKNVISSFKNTSALIDMNELGHLQEFLYLKQECVLRCIILYCDFLDRPWSAYMLMKKFQKRKNIEVQQDRTFNEYEDKINRKCIVWYIKKRKIATATHNPTSTSEV
jgi:hypothetical protein